MSDSAAEVNAPRASITGWPTIEDASEFTGVDVGDEVLQQALAGAIDYGNIVLSDRFVGTVPTSVFAACLDYTGSMYTQRIGQADILVDGVQGSTPQQRYRRILLANRFVGIA